jgi:hypothetical protein
MVCAETIEILGLAVQNFSYVFILPGQRSPPRRAQRGACQPDPRRSLDARSGHERKDPARAVWSRELDSTDIPMTGNVAGVEFTDSAG